jgi:hypothetical protein
VLRVARQDAVPDTLEFRDGALVILATAEVDPVGV